MPQATRQESPPVTARDRSLQHRQAPVTEYWSQEIIGEANGQLFKVAKGSGETRWHKHDDQDEIFIVYRGHLTIRSKDRNIEPNEEDMFSVPLEVEHCPMAEHEAEFLIVGLDVTSSASGGKPDT
jgi:mannose-6-phosphate isomerase-like protein (cupin superfamily)